MSSDREKGVLATFEATSRAWADGDAHAFVAWYADDATVILPGVNLAGKADIDGAMAAAFAGPLKRSRRVHDARSTRFLDGDTAIVVTRSETVFPGEASVPPDRQELATWVLTSHDGRWLVRSYHSCLAS
jgi:uncharacterized protein (TIGR02246 family)